MLLSSPQQTGDIIVPRYVVLGIDWRNGFSSGTLNIHGAYIKSDPAHWHAAFGAFSATESATTGIVYRDGNNVYEGAIYNFGYDTDPNAVSGATGRRNTNAGVNDFQGHDYFLPLGMACPTTILPPLTPVSITAAPAVSGFSEGTFFKFDNLEWKAAFIAGSYASCANTCLTSGSTNDFGHISYFHVRQCRNGSEIWSGLVATSFEHFLYPNDGAVGRRNNNDQGVFTTGDTIVPYSRTCEYPYPFSS